MPESDDKCYGRAIEKILENGHRIITKNSYKKPHLSFK